MRLTLAAAGCARDSTGEEMNKRQRIVQVCFLAGLLAMSMSMSSCGSGQTSGLPLTPSPTPDPPTSTPALVPPTAAPTTALPLGGEWQGPGDLLQIGFTVSSDSTAIASTCFTFPGAVVSETTTVTPKSGDEWPIVDGKFRIEVVLPKEITGTTEKTIVVDGVFDATGLLASGTWQMQSPDTTTSGDWKASPVM